MKTIAALLSLAAFALTVSCSTEPAEPDPLLTRSPDRSILHEPGMGELALSVCEALDARMTAQEIYDTIMGANDGTGDITSATALEVMREATYEVCPEHRGRIPT